MALLAALAAALVATPVVAVPSVGAPRAAVEPTPLEPTDGSPKGGDDYFPWDGNGGYDVQRYRVVATFRPRDGWLRGRATVAATVGETPLRSLSLDLALTPDWVRVDGTPARFSKPHRHELRVTPAQPLAAGADVSIAVGYHGYPARVRTTGADPFVWRRGEAMAVGEPQIGAWWFPANETPNDKAAFDVTVRVPRGQQAISNGHLVSRSVGPRWTSWRWRQQEPVVTYLAFFAAGRFQLQRSVVDGRETVYAVSKRLSRSQRAQSFRLLRRTPGITRWLEGWLGPYPYTTNGGVVSSLWAGFALENAGRPTYPYVGGPGDRWNLGLVVHEVAHQWFGNDVSLTRWRDIWLNEGFASYAEWAWAEHKWGVAVHDRLRRDYDGKGPTHWFWGLTLSDPGRAKVFDVPVYDRGAMTVAALRCRIGTSRLDTLLQTWLTRHAGGHGTMAGFRDLAEEVSGEELDGLFHAWLDSPTKPADTADNGLRDCVPDA
jgi:aminopeptidase N